MVSAGLPLRRKALSFWQYASSAKGIYLKRSRLAVDRFLCSRGGGKLSGREAESDCGAGWFSSDRIVAGPGGRGWAVVWRQDDTGHVHHRSERNSCLQGCDRQQAQYRSGRRQNCYKLCESHARRGDGRENGPDDSDPTVWLQREIRLKMTVEFQALNAAPEFVLYPGYALAFACPAPCATVRGCFF